MRRRGHRCEGAWKRWLSEEGFTLAEMLVVMVIIGLMAMATVPNLGAFHRAYRVRVASEQLVGHLRAARQIAVTQRVLVSFTIDPSPQNDYSINYTIPGESATNQTFTLAKEVNVMTTPSGALTFTFKQDGTVGNPTIPDAQAPTANYVRLEHPVTSNRTDQYTISVLVAGTVDVKVVR